MPPAELGPARSPYAQFPQIIERDWLGRWCHLSEADIDLAQRRTSDATKLGFGVQLATVRAVGTFLADPTDVPYPVVAAVARQLNVDDVGVLAGYGKLPARWKHTSEIKARYGYQEFTSQPAHGQLVRWLYRMAWNDDLGPTVMFRAAHARLMTDRVLLPGEVLLTRLIGTVRQRASERLWTRLVRLAEPELIDRLESLLVVPDNERRSEFDRLRRSPVSPTVGGLVTALDRLAEVRAVGAGHLDLSRLPARRVWLASLKTLGSVNSLISAQCGGQRR